LKQRAFLRRPKGNNCMYVKYKVYIKGKGVKDKDREPRA
jgi:hypothetical protein